MSRMKYMISLMMVPLLCTTTSIVFSCSIENGHMVTVEYEYHTHADGWNSTVASGTLRFNTSDVAIESYFRDAVMGLEVGQTTVIDVSPQDMGYEDDVWTRWSITVIAIECSETGGGEMSVSQTDTQDTQDETVPVENTPSGELPHMEGYLLWIVFLAILDVFLGLSKRFIGKNART